VFQALLATSKTLKAFLEGQIQLRGLTLPVELKTPTEMNSAGGTGLSVWLYHVVRDENRLNDAPVRVSPTQEKRAPLPLRLHYLITGINITRELEQLTLGLVLQAFHGHPRLFGSDLQAEFAGSGLELNVRLEQLSLDQLSLAWDALSSAYQLSLSYEVALVPIDVELITPIGPPVTSFAVDAEILVADLLETVA
jgi:Pvc16 N-terminal domain